MECNLILESYHRDYLIDIEMVDYFPEELLEINVRNKIMLNPYRKSHSEIVAKTCNQMLNMIDVENEL